MNISHTCRSIRPSSVQIMACHLFGSSHFLNLKLPLVTNLDNTWWRHQMATFSALLAFWVRNSLVTGEFPSQRPVMRSSDVFFHLRLNKRLNKQSWGWWFQTPSLSLWRHSMKSQWNLSQMQLHIFLLKNEFPWRATLELKSRQERHPS